LQHVVQELRKISLKELRNHDKAEKRIKIDNDLKAWEKNEDMSKPKNRGRPPNQPKLLTSEK